ncbi:MAG: hypothetical protein IKH04_12225 [Kiritimatiellae bacterium]|nr:hypothetical protein [Kiritimatiellia bacterium]
MKMEQMGNFKTIDEVRAYFSGDRFATENGMTLDECDGNHAVTSLALDARHRNALGGVMGGDLHPRRLRVRRAD